MSLSAIGLPSALGAPMICPGWPPGIWYSWRHYRLAIH